MPDAPAPNSIQRLLVVLPNWVGDVVLATPVLAALRAHFTRARITYLLRPYVTEIVDGSGWYDELVTWPNGKGLRRELQIGTMVRRLRQSKFDLALLLTNSFRSAFAVWRAGARRRTGYARDGRTWLLNDRLRPLKRHGEFVPRSVLDSYSDLAQHLGCPVTDRHLRLPITPAQESAGRQLQEHYHLNNGRRYAAINVGAAFGAAKCWLPERFAATCERLAAEQNLQPVLVGAPHEAALLRRIADLATTDVTCCVEPGTTLGSLKVLVRDAAVLVCNDTGPRHYGLAFDVPTVTIFGPTHQEWTDTDYTGEIKLQARVECGPCQLKTCPIDLRCMHGVTVDHVLTAVAAVREQDAR